MASGISGASPAHTAPYSGNPLPSPSTGNPNSGESFCGNWIAPRAADPEDRVAQPIFGTHQGAGLGLRATLGEIERHKLLYRLFPGLAAGLVLTGLPALIDPALAQAPAPATRRIFRRR